MLNREMENGSAPSSLPDGAHPSGSEPTVGRRVWNRSLPPRAALIWEYGLIVLGAAVIALNFSVFLNGNGVVNGGLTGLSTLLARSRFHIEPALTQIVLNIPLFLLSASLLGRRVGAKSIAGAALMPLFVFLTRNVHPVTSNTLLAALYGGVGLGVGLGLLFRGGGSVGGTSLGAQLLSRLTGMSQGAGQMLLDGAIILAAGFTLGADRAMYGLISLYVTKRTIDVVLTGLSTSKLALIISHSPESVETIRRGIIEEMDRGLTVLSGSGGFTGEDRPVLMVVVGPSEVARLKTLVHAADPRAFVILSDAAEVLGEGFRQFSPVAGYIPRRPRMQR
jgi:uncharacterized membrane-anchored protein YitT (DUF2179 family)